MNKIKGVAKRLICSVVVLLMAIGVALTQANYVKADAGTTKVIIHYHRFNDDYTNWNLWVWNGENGGADIKPAPPFQFTGQDDFGKVAELNINLKTSKLGFIVRKGEWEAKDIASDRFIGNINGTKEVWLVQDDEKIYDTKPEVLPKMSASIDAKNSITVKLAKSFTLTGKDFEGFEVIRCGDKETPVKIKSVGNAKLQASGNELSQKSYERGYELINGGNEIKFVLKKGSFGFSDEMGKLSAYVSGTMNDWGGTSGPKSKYEAIPTWKMSWNSSQKQYELIKKIGASKDQVAIGNKFKFTSYDGKNATWYPGGAGGDIMIEKIASSDADTSTTDIVKINLDENVDITGHYEVRKKGYKSSTVRVGDVLSGAEYTYTKDDLGVIYTQNRSVFKLWAPTATQVNVLVFNDEKTDKYEKTAMKLGEKGVWDAGVKGDLTGKYYLYEVTVPVNGDNKTYKVNDPYAFGTSVNSGRSLIYDRDKVNAAVRNWDKDTYVKLDKNVDAILYEMHVRDFSISPSSGVKSEYRGKYMAFTQEGTKTNGGATTCLDHLKELGITHVHLLPTYDYGTGDENSEATTYNWGYDPVLFNNVEGMYATDPNGTTRQIEYKKMVQSLHNKGIGVVTEVVFNHTLAVGDNEKSVFDKIVPGYYYRFDEDGNYSNGSGCSNEVASEKPMVRKFILDSVKYWMKEYHIDGLRFDLMALLDKDTIAEVYKEAKKINPNAIIYGEGWTGGASSLSPDLKMEKGNLKTSGLSNVAMFNDEIREDVKGNNDGDVKGFAQGAGFRNGKDRLEKEISGASDFVSNPNQTINYVSAHDNLCLWDKIAKSNINDTEQTRIKMSNLANAIILTSQGVPFIQGGSEFARSKSAASNPANTYNDVKGNDIDWALKDKYADMTRYYAGLIALRKAHPAFRMSDPNMVKDAIVFTKTSGNTVQYTIDGSANKDSWKNIMVIINGEKNAKTFDVKGEWNIVANGQKAGVDTLETAKDKITMDGYSLIVAYQK